MAVNKNECPICKNDSAQWTSLKDYISQVDCPRCGKFKITRSAIEGLQEDNAPTRKRLNASSWIREQGNVILDSKSKDTLFSVKTPSFYERAEKLLQALERKTKFIGDGMSLAITDKELQGDAWCQNSKELSEFFKFIHQLKWIDIKQLVAGKVAFLIAPAGWEHLEKLKKTNQDSQQGFVAMWFNDEIRPVYDNAIAPAIEQAGYRPHRVDQREHNDKIDDEIIVQIRRSRFVVADFTGQRGGVYFEAGFAKGMNLEVFWTCRKDDANNLHFDIRQYNCILWEPDKIDDFKTRLAHRIEAVLGRGSYRPAVD